MTTDDGSVSGLDIQSGTQIWKVDALQGRGVSGPFGLEPRGFAVVGDYKGLLYLLDAASGKFVGRKKGGRRGPGDLRFRRRGSLRHSVGEWVADRLGGW